MKKVFATLFVLGALAAAGFGQDGAKYSYDAQAAFIPKERGHHIRQEPQPAPPP